MHTELVHELIMAESETGVSNLMDDLDLDKTYETGYEEDIKVENVAFINGKIQIFADDWMKLYSNHCLQRDYA